jgi:hypothetical protein
MLAYPVPSSPGLSCPAVMHACLPTQSIAHAASPSHSLSPTEPSSLSRSQPWPPTQHKLACPPSLSLAQPLPWAALFSHAANPSLSGSTHTLAHPVPHCPGLSCPAISLSLVWFFPHSALFSRPAKPLAQHIYACLSSAFLPRPLLSSRRAHLLAHPVHHSRSLSLAQPSSLAQPTLASRAAHIHLPIQSLAPPPSLVQPSASPSCGFSLTQLLSPSQASCPTHACSPTQSIASVACCPAISLSLSLAWPSSLTQTSSLAQHILAHPPSPSLARHPSPLHQTRTTLRHGVYPIWVQYPHRWETYPQKPAPQQWVQVYRRPGVHPRSSLSVRRHPFTLITAQVWL